MSIFDVPIIYSDKYLSELLGSDRSGLIRLLCSHALSLAQDQAQSKGDMAVEVQDQVPTAISPPPPWTLVNILLGRKLTRAS